MSYSVWSLMRNALSGHRDWPPAWRSPPPKPLYDVILVGAGGHGLATAYYLARNHNITNVAVIERGWLGGGNTGRNTTIVRSNYLYPESARLYEFSLKLYQKFTHPDMFLKATGQDPADLDSRDVDEFRAAIDPGSRD